MESQSTKNQRRHVFAFFGSDVEAEGVAFLPEASIKGWTLLALDAPAIGMAAEAKLAYTLIDDWVDSAAMRQAREKAAECEQEWFQAATDQFTSDEVCWPQFDHHAMHWFWADVMLAMALVEEFQVCDVQELRFFPSRSRRPAVYYYPSDVCSSLWDAELPGVAKPYQLPRMRPATSKKALHYRVLRYSRSRVRKVVRVVRRWCAVENPGLTTPSALRGRVVLAFNPGESYRFTPVIERLGEDLPGEIAAAILSHDQATADGIAAQWSIPVACGPPSAPVDPGLRQQFLRGYARALERSSGQPWQKPLKHLQFHFEYYCAHRWPMLSAGLRFWSGLWSQAQPKAVLVSALQDGESQLPAEAAKRLGVPTVSIPHGAGLGRSSYSMIVDYILCGHSVQSSSLERFGVPATRVLPCRDVVVENEYPVASIPVDTTRGCWHLLVLTDPIGSAGCLAPTTSPGAQVVALRTLANPPTDIARHLSLRIKVHPGYPDLELIAAASARLLQRVLPPNYGLKSALRQTDLVVALNYCGSALVHALRAEKPVIFFWTDPLIGRTEPRAHADSFLPAATLVRNPEEFWRVVRSFFTNPELAEEMHLRAGNFFRDNLDDSSYPSIGEVLDRVLSKQTSTRFSPPMMKEDARS